MLKVEEDLNYAASNQCYGLSFQIGKEEISRKKVWFLVSSSKEKRPKKETF